MPEDLFEKAVAERLRQEAPLARRVTPRSLDEIVGQDAILGPGKILRRAVEADRLTSLILYGPPGSGKTALARVIAMRTKAAFEPLNAVTSGVKELRRLMDAAKQRQVHEQRRTIVFIDELHRFNRAQQDALLPAVENGTIILIGATTENPFFSVVAPLLSRSQIFEFQRLTERDVVGLIDRALAHSSRGFPDLNVVVDPDAKAHIATYSEGDARRALNALEIGMLTTPPEGDTIHITVEVAAECIQHKMLHYDGTGDEHYDAASAFIKSMRGTDPDSALYWMARMLEAGESPRFIARRICICASEDVGNADPMALVVATAAWGGGAGIRRAHAAQKHAPAPKRKSSWPRPPPTSPAPRKATPPTWALPRRSRTCARRRPSPCPSTYKTSATAAPNASAAARATSTPTTTRTATWPRTTVCPTARITGPPTAAKRPSSRGVSRNSTRGQKSKDEG